MSQALLNRILALEAENEKRKLEIAELRGEVASATAPDLHLRRVPMPRTLALMGYKARDDGHFGGSDARQH